MGVERNYSVLRAALHRDGRSAPLSRRFTCGIESLYLLEEAGLTLGAAWAGFEEEKYPLPPYGFQTSDRPARSESLHRLRSPGHTLSLRFLKVQILAFEV
jgi:hypothetical protein